MHSVHNKGGIFYSQIYPVALLCFLVGISATAAAHGFDESPHVLVTVGHTSSAEWDNATQRYVTTCDYKSRSGAVPRYGEACDGSPRLSLSVDDLKSLRYITGASDNLEFVRRVYENFDDILFISSTDASATYGGGPYVSFRQVVPVDIDISAYDFFASKAMDILRSGQGDSDSLGTVIGPFNNHPAFGGTLEDTDRLLPEYTLAFFTQNPDRTTLTHELVHFLINRAQKRSIVKPSRFIELGKNRGKQTYLAGLLKVITEKDYDSHTIANLDLMNLEYALEGRAMVGPQELEVAYFISKYGRELNLSDEAINIHRDYFWWYTDYFRKVLGEVFENTVNGLVPDSTVNAINSNASFQIDGRLIQGYFRDYYKRLKAIAAAYPMNLLGDENRVNFRNPRTIIDHFVVDIGPRNSTTASR